MDRGRNAEELLTARLSLRRPVATDVAAILAVHSNPAATAHNASDAISDEDAARDLFLRWDDHWQRFGFGYWVVRRQENLEPLGFCGVKVMPVAGRPALNLFYRLAPTAWGQGVAGEAAAEVVRWARRTHPDYPHPSRLPARCPAPSGEHGIPPGRRQGRSAASGTPRQRRPRPRLSACQRRCGCSVIIWLNGTFGVGKSSTSAALAPLLAGSRVFDPETVGYLLRDHLLDLPVHDFQDWPAWRSLVAATAGEIARQTGALLIAPQTVLNPSHLEEIFQGLEDRGLSVFHVLLDADDDVLRRRIAAVAEARDWRLGHLADYALARPWLREAADLVVNTGERSIQETAEDIAAAAPTLR